MRNVHERFSLRRLRRAGGFSCPSAVRVAASALLVACLIASGVLPGRAAYGQDGDAGGQAVTGTVTDEGGTAIPGASVLVVGTDRGTTTGADGQYEVRVPEPQSDSLEFSFVGYATETVAVSGRSEIDVTLTSATVEGEEVVVTGYTTQQRAELTGSVEVVDVEDMQQRSATQVTDQMQGMVSGVSVNTSGQPGDQPQINIRGFNTFGNNQPLFVVDGVPTQDISYLNPRDIASMQVLKDAGAAAQYGARASNGVVIITTNQGQGDVSVNYDANVGYQVPESGNVWDALSPQEQGRLEWMAQRNSGNENPQHAIWGDGEEPDVPEFILPARAENPDMDSYFVNPRYTDASSLGDFVQIIRANQDGTNWYDAMTDPALATQHNLSVGGGGETGSYFTSLSYTNQQGVVMNTSLERYTVRANTEFNVSDNVRIGENITFALSENYQTGTLQEGTALGMSYRQHTIIPVRDVMGNFAGTQAPDLGNAKNPVAFRERAETDDDENRRLFGNIFAEIDFFDDLTLRSSLGANIESGYFASFSYPEYENSENVTTNAYTERTYNDRSWTFTNTLTYQGMLGENHNLTVLGGAEAIRENVRYDAVGRQGYFSFDPNYTQLATGSGTPTINATVRSQRSLLSFIGDVDYSYDSKYLLGLTLRYDGSSVFAGSQWGAFPSITAGWRISEEPFMDGTDWLSSLKIRGGYGTVGNQLNVDPNNAFTLFGGTVNDSYYAIDGSNGDTQQGFRQVRLGNPNAEWERNIDINFGFDASLFEGGLRVTADYYQRRVEDLLYAPELNATAGAASPPFRNVAEMVNQGLDLSISTQHQLFGALDVDAGLNFTSYNNEIKSIAEGIEQFSEDFRRFGVPIVRNEVGHPISSFYGYEIAGFWQSQDEIDQANDGVQDGTYMQDAGVGRFRYEDTDGDGEITTEDRTHLGSPHPDFSYGLNLNLAYGNWDFTAFVYGEQGGEIWNNVKWWTDFRGTFNGAKSETALYDSWTPDNRDASAPIQETGAYFSTSNVPNSYFVEDGSFLKMKNLQLGYTLPGALAQRIGAGSLRIYAQAENVFTITGYSGLDPEIGSTESAESAGGATTTSFGIDGGVYPTPRTFTLGVNLSF